MNLLKVDRVLARLLPRQCGLCGLPSRDDNTCAGCRDDLPWITRPCACCAAPLPAGYAGRVCGRCDIATGRLDSVHAALVYEFPVDRVATRAKFQRRPECARLLGEWLAYSLRGLEHSSCDAVVPVPLHPSRLGTRGFNQAEEISRAVTERFGLRHLRFACERVTNTPAQTELSGAQRRRNLRHAFRASPRLSGLNVVVVDDVVTTGSTLVAVSESILAAGAASVRGWVAARAVSAYAKRIVE